MKEKLEQHIQKNNLFKKQDRLLLAISGGSDSVALAHLLKANGYQFSLAHCNFSLRNKESDGDESYVRKIAKDLGVEVFIQKFETQKYAKNKNISIQMAARELRYAWFDQILENNGFQYLLTAHHKDDDVETFFLHILRGTGIYGMLGINPKHGKMVRPLLPFHKQEIVDYLQKNGIIYREDSSNKENKYWRNKIRLQLIPLLKEMNPSIADTVHQEMGYLRQVAIVFEERIKQVRAELIKPEKKGYSILIKELQKYSPLPVYLHELLKTFGLFPLLDIEQALNGPSGKQFFSSTHRLIIDREKLFIQPFIKKTSKDELLISESEKRIEHPINCQFRIDGIVPILQSKQLAMLDYEKLDFPLLLRKWEKGDIFYPLGMNKRKKVSDFLIDNKIPIPEKEDIWVLCSKANIVWLVGHRIDNRFKVTPITKKMYIAELF